MKLYYLGGKGNFGDFLNPWIWDKVIPGVLDEDESCAFVGIGTLINQKMLDRTPNAQRRIIFSSGAGYGKSLLSLDDTYQVYCVRGPITARRLSLPIELAITDGAMLLRKLYQPQYSTQYKFAYMPHYNFAGDGWRSVCEQLGFCYIDPCSPIETILHQISSTEVLLTEAMHGAIAADALRVPWVSVINDPAILLLKWQDWCASVGLFHNPYYLDRLHHPSSKTDLLSPVRKLRDGQRQKQAMNQLAAIAKKARPMLSQEVVLDALVDQLLAKVDAFKQDVLSD